MKKVLLILLFILIIPINVQALEEKTSNINDNGQVNKLYDYILNMKTEYDVLKDLDAKSYVDEFMKTGNGKLSTKKVSEAFVTYAFKEVAATLKLMTIVIIICIICALLNNLQKAFSNESLSSIAYFACYAMLIIVVSKSFYTGITIAKDTINQMADFMAALIPVLMMLLASVGGFTEATIMDPFIIGAINLSTRLFVSVIIPLILISFVLEFVNNISEDYKISKLTKLFSQAAIWMQGIIMTVFIGIVTIRGITSKTIDQVTAKTAKYAVDNFVPVVGKCLSDAISTVAGYSLLLKNAFSGLGLIIILVIVLFPIIKLLIISFMYKLTAALVEPISDSRLVNCITSAGNSMILLMSCLISVSTMFFIMISIIATAGKMAVGG